MNLKKIIRRKFLPPTNKNGTYNISSVSHYEIDIDTKTGSYTPILFLQHNASLHGYKPQKDKGYNSFYSHGRNIEYFDTIEEARSAAWENYDSCYKNDIKQMSDRDVVQ